MLFKGVPQSHHSGKDICRISADIFKLGAAIVYLLLPLIKTIHA